MSDLQKQVQVLLDELVDSGAETGLQAAVYRRGELVVDAVAGVADVETGRPVTPDSVFYAASALKAVGATVVHVLVEKGVLSYDTRVAQLWPEYAAHGKEATTLRHVLTHSAGIPAIPAGTTPAQFCDAEVMAGLIADLEPWWTPGARVGYHAVTFGFVLAEVVRRATGRPISQVLAEDVAGPLGVADEVFFGVPQAQRGRVAPLVDDPAGVAAFAALPPDLPLFRSGPRELFPNAALANNPDVLGADIPAWGTASARGLARVYAALLDEVDGVRLVSPERLRLITTLSTDGIDEMTGGPAQYGLGYTLGTVGMTPVAPTVFGMVGIGGSAAYADPATGVSVALTKNRFNPVEMNAYEQVRALAVAAFR
ncbi:serine hydrolase [Pseudonocardia sp. CNS-139]|nr:serine hydrolase [Pseudonocardia sp. CNS-139]